MLAISIVIATVSSRSLLFPYKSKITSYSHCVFLQFIVVRIPGTCNTILVDINLICFCGLPFVLLVIMPGISYFPRFTSYFVGIEPTSPLFSCRAEPSRMRISSPSQPSLRAARTLPRISSSILRQSVLWRIVLHRDLGAILGRAAARPRLCSPARLDLDACGHACSPLALARGAHGRI